MAIIDKLDSQQLAGMLKAKFGEEDMNFETIKSVSQRGEIKNWIQKGEITGSYKCARFKIAFNTDYEFMRLRFYEKIGEENYEEFNMLIDVIMGQKALFNRYAYGVETEWINNDEYAKGRLNVLSARHERFEILRDDFGKSEPVAQATQGCSRIANIEL